MRSITFQERYFASKDEWYYFLKQCGIDKSLLDTIDEVTIEVLDSDIDVTFNT